MELFYVKYTVKDKLAYPRFAHGEWELFNLADARTIRAQVANRPEVAEVKIYRAAYTLGHAVSDAAETTPGSGS